MTGEERYFYWLGELVGLPSDSDQSYWEICRILHQKIFYWTIQNDENRAIDGQGLRVRYQRETGYLVDLDHPATVLEVMIALVDRMCFIMADEESEPVEGESYGYFFAMLATLGVSNCTDGAFYSMEWRRDLVDSAAEMMLARQYSSDGLGGIFHIGNPYFDARKMELWYQMQTYLLENYC